MRLKLALTLAWSLCLLLFAAGCNSVPDTEKAAENSTGSTSFLPFANAKTGPLSRHTLVPHEITIPAGTPISVRLQDSLSSASNRSKDKFEAVLGDAIVVDGKTVAPRGAAAEGQVLAVRSSGRMHDSGYLRLALVSLQIKGKAVPVRTSSVFAAGTSHQKRNLALIGGGAGTGALIGTLAGGGKGALNGGAVGAGAGTTGAYATGKKDVSFAPERRLTFRLTQPVTVRE